MANSSPETLQMVEKFILRVKSVQISLFVVVLAMIAGIYMTVYVTGGIKYVYAQPCACRS